MTATGASAIRGSAFQPSAIGFGFPRLVPERPDPELQAPVPVTCHPEWTRCLAACQRASRTPHGPRPRLLRSSSPCQRIPAASGRLDFKIRTGFRQGQLRDGEAGQGLIETLRDFAPERRDLRSGSALERDLGLDEFWFHDREHLL